MTATQSTQWLDARHSEWIDDRIISPTKIVVFVDVDGKTSSTQQDGETPQRAKSTTELQIAMSS